MFFATEGDDLLTLLLRRVDQRKNNDDGDEEVLDPKKTGLDVAYPLRTRIVQGGLP